MKNNIILLLSITLLWGTYSCVDVLDLNDTETHSNLAVWSTEETADMYVTASYKTFTDVSPLFNTGETSNSRTVFYDSYSDIMKATDWDISSYYNRALLQASAFVTGSAGSLDCWSLYADRIRRANVLMNEINTFGVKNYGEEWSNIRRAEVRLCRAFTYYRLIRVYGGVILRTDVSGTRGGTDDGSDPADVNRARATEDASWDFVLSELQWAAERLPETWPPAWEGRATNKTAYGLLSRMALYARKWQTAAEAAEKVKELGGALAADYAKVFQVRGGQDNSKELLFTMYGLEKSVIHSWDREIRPFGDGAVHNFSAMAGHVPTAELADLYEFKDGTPFDWNTWSGAHADPYTDREPRFHATILYNGSTWEGRTIETFEGGKDGFRAFTQSASTGGRTCTGYYLRKYLMENYPAFRIDGSYQYDAMLRYAEVLLNKAEAYAELDYTQHRDKALAALNEVRARVKLPARTAADAPDKDAFMELLRRERCVELAGEGFRYWDLRRWKLAESVINGKNAHGVKITRNGDEYAYERVACDGGTPRIFLPKYYYFSLPNSELANNKLCENNDYW